MSAVETRIWPEISVVVPCFNEEESISLFLAEMDRFADRLPSMEVIFVDDGSTDGTCEQVEKLGRNRPFHVHLVKLSRNFGHQLALLAGMRQARGAACVTMDVDLQDPPGVIVEMVERWREGAAVVIGQRSDRSTDTFFKRQTAGLFYRLISFLTDGAFPEHVGDFRLVDRKVLDIMANTREVTPYWRGLAIWVGFPRAMVLYRRQARQVGDTKFSIHKMLAFAFNAIFSFSRKPLQIASYLGFLVSGFSVAVIAAHIVLFFLPHKPFVPGWLSTFSLVGLIGGIQLICIGILGEYVGRIYELSLGRPNVVVRETRLVSEVSEKVRQRSQA